MSEKWRQQHKHPCQKCGELVHYCSLFCKKCAAIERGKNPEYKKKQSLSHLGLKNKLGWKDTPETIEKKRAVWTKEKKELARQRAIKNKYDPEWIKKVSSYGEKNPMWRGGIARSGYVGFHQLLKDEIRKRDNFQCQLCGMPEKESIKKFNHKLGINHIDYDKTNCKEKNLITLCNRCNSKINYDREKWKKYFQNKIVSIYWNGSQKITADVRIAD